MIYTWRSRLPELVFLPPPLANVHTSLKLNSFWVENLELLTLRPFRFTWLCWPVKRCQLDVVPFESLISMRTMLIVWARLVRGDLIHIQHFQNHFDGSTFYLLIFRFVFNNRRKLEICIFDFESRSMELDAQCGKGDDDQIGLMFCGLIPSMWFIWLVVVVVAFFLHSCKSFRDAIILDNCFLFTIFIIMNSQTSHQQMICHSELVYVHFVI